MKIAALVLAYVLTAATGAWAAEPVRGAVPEPQHPHIEAMHRPAEPQRVRFCFNSTETREKIISRRLTEPFRLLRGAAGRVQGEALRAKLCRWNDEYVYEIALLRHDGHIVHVYLNAASGQAVGAFNEH